MAVVRNKKSEQINFTISFKSIIFAAPNKHGGFSSVG